MTYAEVPIANRVTGISMYPLLRVGVQIATHDMLMLACSQYGTISGMLNFYIGI